MHYSLQIADCSMRRHTPNPRPTSYTLQSYESLNHCALRGQLQLIVQRHKLSTWPVAPSQRQPNQVVGEKRILGQQRAVHVAAECVAVDRALGAILAIVAVARQHAPERLRARPKV